MLFSRSFIPTSREEPKIAECVSHRLMLKTGLIYMVSAGIYAYLPLGLKVLRKIENIIRKRMNEEGALELFMSALQPLEIWQQTGRDKDLRDVMITFKDRKGHAMCLGPTHEEEVTEIVKRYILSYRQLPVILYQIQTKFRDEARPRFGLLRSCEFIMKDAYSFDTDAAGLDISYAKMLSAYERIFKDLQLRYVITRAESGIMGGNVSCEFMISSDAGEDTLFMCGQCNKYFKKGGNCSICQGKLKPEKMIEAGHIFKLGTKYSQAQRAFFLDKAGHQLPVIMGCYGIGVSRLLAAIIEQNHDRRGIIWPGRVSGFDASLLVLDLKDEFLFKAAQSLYEMLEKNGFDILFDDRVEPAGVKFNDAYLIGNPYIIIVGSRYKDNNKFELEARGTAQKFLFSSQELLNFFKQKICG